ncbi:MAG TPA: GxxExxY protein [Tepidisphaeraceae bacterium]|jgi:GxxExxY protein
MENEPIESVAQLKDPQTYKLIGAAMEVHRVLGPGFLEAVYRQALRVELAARSVPFACEVELVIAYKDVKLDCKYKADFVCYGEVLLECKAQRQLATIDRAQVINYLKATGFRRALLMNFGGVTLEYERIVVGY